MHEVSSVVLTVSDRVSAGARPDGCGPALVGVLVAAGYETIGRVVPDGADNVRTALLDALATGARLVVTTGGTGVGPRDRTPEGTRAVIDRELPGVAERLRAEGARTSPHAALTRGVIGIVDASQGSAGAFVVNLPGSPEGAREGLELVLPLVPHVLDQVSGGDH